LKKADLSKEDMAFLEEIKSKAKREGPDNS